MVAGIYAYTYIVDNLVHDINIVGNQIIECSYGNNKLGALCIGALTDTQDETILEKNVNVTNNLFENCGGETQGIIFISHGNKLTFNNNIVKGLNENISNDNVYAMNIGRNSQMTSKNIMVCNNIFDINNNHLARGISISKAENGIVSNNVFNFISSNLNGVLVNNNANVSIFGNMAIAPNNIFQNNSAKGFSLPVLLNDTNIGNNEIASYYHHLVHKDGTGSFAYIPKLIDIQVFANGTAEPQFVINKGADYIDSVVNISQGFQIKFKNVQGTPAIIPFFGSGNPFVTSGGVYYDYLYLRQASNTNAIIGIKQQKDSQGHASISSFTAGNVHVLILA